MQTKPRTIKARTATYRKLKVLAAERGVTMLDLLDQMVEREEKREGEQPARATTGG